MAGGLQAEADRSAPPGVRGIGIRVRAVLDSLRQKIGWGLLAETDASAPPSAVVDIYGMPVDPGARAEYLRPIASKLDIQLPRPGLGLLGNRKASAALGAELFGDPLPDDPTPAEAEAMRVAEEARIAELRKQIRSLGRPANPGTTPLGIDDQSGLGFGGDPP